MPRMLVPDGAVRRNPDSTERKDSGINDAVEPTGFFLKPGREFGRFFARKFFFWKLHNKKSMVGQNANDLTLLWPSQLRENLADRNKTKHGQWLSPSKAQDPKKCSEKKGFCSKPRNPSRANSFRNVLKLAQVEGTQIIYLSLEQKLNASVSRCKINGFLRVDAHCYLLVYRRQGSRNSIQIILTNARCASEFER